MYFFKFSYLSYCLGYVEFKKYFSYLSRFFKNFIRLWFKKSKTFTTLCHCDWFYLATHCFHFSAIPSHSILVSKGTQSCIFVCTCLDIFILDFFFSFLFFFFFFFYICALTQFEKTSYIALLLWQINIWFPPSAGLNRSCCPCSAFWSLNPLAGFPPLLLFFSFF